MDAFQEKEKRDIERMNFCAWLNGIYMGYSLSAVLGENTEYPERPLDLFQSLTEEEQIQREEQMVSAFVAAYNATI